MSGRARRAGSGPPHQGEVSADEAWAFFLVSLALSAILEVIILVCASTAAGAWAKSR